MNVVIADSPKVIIRPRCRAKRCCSADEFCIMKRVVLKDGVITYHSFFVILHFIAEYKRNERVDNNTKAAKCHL